MGPAFLRWVEGALRASSLSYLSLSLQCQASVLVFDDFLREIEMEKRKKIKEE